MWQEAMVLSEGALPCCTTLLPLSSSCKRGKVIRMLRQSLCALITLQSHQHGTGKEPGFHVPHRIVLELWEKDAMQETAEITPPGTRWDTECLHAWGKDTRDQRLGDASWQLPSLEKEWLAARSLSLSSTYIHARIILSTRMQTPHEGEGEKGKHSEFTELKPSVT